MVRALRSGVKAGVALFAAVAALLLNAGAVAAAPLAQTSQVNQGPLAPPIVFILLLALLFAAVLVFSYISYRNAGR